MREVAGSKPARPKYQGRPTWLKIGTHTKSRSLIPNLSSDFHFDTRYDTGGFKCGKSKFSDFDIDTAISTNSMVLNPNMSSDFHFETYLR